MARLRGGLDVPSGPLPLLALRSGALLPSALLTLPVGRERSLALLRTLRAGALLATVAQRNSETAEPGRADLHDVGTFARLRQVERIDDRQVRVVLEGVGRFSLDELVQTEPFFTARVTHLEDQDADTDEARQLATGLRELVSELSARSGQSIALSAEPSDPSAVADQLAAALGLPLERELEVLAETNVTKRLRRVAELLAEVRTLADLRRKLDTEVRKELNKNQREALLREQLRALKKELGDDKGAGGDADKLRERLEGATLPAEVRTAAERELGRLEGMPPQGAEYNVIRSYLEWILEVPWEKRAAVNSDLDAVSAKLDADHAGLTEVKQRILEHLAVLKLGGNPRGTILCLYGPPGVGKTSLGQSIADATGRPFVRIALGGVRDEAEVRGHRRTYVGALPGRIIHGLKKAGVKNPVVLLDEIDKLGQGHMGSPEAALLEVLDPEQNKTYTDHYMELPFDLSEVLFLCTANSLDTLSAPLRDRMEIVELHGYTPQEKLAIARTHLLPRLLRESAIDGAALELSDEALAAVVRDYTREAGVRQLQRELTRLLRGVALKLARGGKETSVRIEESSLAELLGKVRYQPEVAERTQVPGVATGLAWTPVGGDILFIETTRMPGKGRLELTGQLGDVMKESARAALSFVRSHAESLGISPTLLEESDLHIHVPAGGVPKDGPSAGVTMFTALCSLLTGRRVRSDTAMTGECTLRGRVMPVGGIKSKVLAAHRAGLKRVILPSRNARDLDEVPAEIRAQLEFILAEDMGQVLAAALEPTVTTEPELVLPLAESAALETQHTH